MGARRRLAHGLVPFLILPSFTDKSNFATVFVRVGFAGRKFCSPWFHGVPNVLSQLAAVAVVMSGRAHRVEELSNLELQPI